MTREAAASFWADPDRLAEGEAIMVLTMAFIGHGGNAVNGYTSFHRGMQERA